MTSVCYGSMKACWKTKLMFLFQLKVHQTNKDYKDCASRKCAPKFVVHTFLRKNIRGLLVKLLPAMQ